MKRLIVSINFISLFLISNAQISTREIISVKEISKPVLYDSTYFGYKESDIDSIKQYIGQSIYLLPINKSDTNKHYTDFYYKPRKNYKTSDLESEWSKPYMIDYESVDDHKFSIIGAGFSKQDPSQWYLELLYNKDDTIYYVAPYQVYYYKSNGLDLLPFVIGAFIEKSKKRFLNSTLITNHELPAYDINKGTNIQLAKDERWVCIDITLLDIGNNIEYIHLPYFMPSLILKNSKGNEVFVNFVKRFDTNYKEEKFIFDQRICSTIDDFYTMDQYKTMQLIVKDREKLNILTRAKAEEQKQGIIKKFGDYYGNLIIYNKVVIGMSKEMSLLSWGKPLRKDELTTESGKYEIWQYDYKTFLYFEGDKLKIIKQ